MLAHKWIFSADLLKGKERGKRRSHYLLSRRMIVPQEEFYTTRYRKKNRIYV